VENGGAGRGGGVESIHILIKSHLSSRYHYSVYYLRMGNRSSSSNGTSTNNMVKYVESDGEWMELMEQSKEKLVVVDFTASW
jgi:hypothetical protein